MRYRLALLAALVLGPVILAMVGSRPSPAMAQRVRTPYRVGVLTDARAANHPSLDGLKAGLRDLGLEEDRDVIFDVRLTDANLDRMPAAAGSLVKAGVDVIFTSGEAATRAARAATPSVPIVFKFIELHGGRIRVESQVGAGSTFVFTLPVGGEGQSG